MLKPGHRLDDFEIVRLLGKGGMGEVYEAKQFHPERRVALKVLSPWLAEDKDALKRFNEETKALAKLDHPGIVRIIATGECDGIAYYVMQLIQGLSLSSLLRLARDTDRESDPSPSPGSTSRDATPDSLGGSDTRPYREPAAPAPHAPPLMNAYRTDRYRAVAQIGLQAAQALASAHRLGLVHRDVKPSNVMIDQHNHVYLVDFGLTRSLDGGAVTRAGILIGTPWYMSPEQAANAKIDCRSDVYSLGVTLYHLATGGQGPYTADRKDTGAILEQVRGGALVPVGELAPEIPPGLAEVLTRALALDPARRYPSAAEMAGDLEYFLQSGKASATLHFLAPKRRRYWLEGAAAAMLMIIIIAILAWRPWRKEDPDPRPPVGGNGQANPESPFKGRQRPLNVSMPLLRDDMQPHLYRILFGGHKGGIQPIGKELVLRSMAIDQPFFLVLDDPGDDPFEFAVEAKPHPQQLDGDFQANMGVFFGWRDKAPDPRTLPRLFILSIDKRPTAADIHGRLQFGTWCFGAQGGDVAHPMEQAPVSILGKQAGKSWIPLPAGDAYRQVRVRVSGKNLKVSLDGELPFHEDFDELLHRNQKLQRYQVQFQGAVGLWVRNGLANFRNATIKALPRED